MDSKEDPWMRLPKPRCCHPPEIYQAIIREGGNSHIRLAQHLQSCGWTLADAGWAAANWDLPTLAAALANERAQRNMRLTTLSDAEVATIKAELAASAATKATGSIQPKRTTRVVRATSRLPARPPTKPEDPPA